MKNPCPASPKKELIKGNLARRSVFTSYPLSGLSLTSLSDQPNTSITENNPLPTAAAQSPIPTLPTFSSDFVFEGRHPDIGLRSSNGIVFYTHRNRLSMISNNAFNDLLNTHDADASGAVVIIALPENSDVIDALIHVIYNHPFEEVKPTLETLLATIPVLKTYGIPLEHFVVPATPLYDQIIAETPKNPMEVYMTAGGNKLEALAIAASGHLLSFKLSEVTDEQSERMGVRYLRRLIRLHFSRIDQLRRIVGMIPVPRAEHLAECAVARERQVEFGWARGAADLAWELRPGQLPIVITTKFRAHI